MTILLQFLMLVCWFECSILNGFLVLDGLECIGFSCIEHVADLFIIWPDASLVNNDLRDYGILVHWYLKKKTQ
jgi:hypothetical protein